MNSTRLKLLSTTVMPAVLVAGVAVGGVALVPLVATPPSYAACNPCNPCAAANPCNPCAVAACNPCAVAKCNPCAAAACNPCAAAKCNPCAAAKCNPCAAAACNPCNPCAAAACNPCNPCAATCNPCNPCGACNPCNPCGAGSGSASLKCAIPRLQKAAACNPCNPCGAGNPCNPCAAAACNPCNPCAAAKCNPCNPCAAANPCNPCGACNPCNPCGAGGSAELTSAEAVAAYDCLRKDMQAAYAKSDDAIAVSYSSWRRYSKHAYVSATHGERYVQNFANDEAKAYGLYEKSGTFPVGAKLAKDSFGVKANGKVSMGPLFTMEKMPAGFNSESDDWRYSMIMPNGTVFGTTKGKGSSKVQFCIGCHQSVAPEQDSVFLLPEEYRVK